MKVMDLLNLLSVAATSVFPMLWELSHRSRSTAVLRCEEVCARIDIAKIKGLKKWQKVMRYMGRRIETVDFTHCKVKKKKSVKFKKGKKRYSKSLQNNEWAWGSYTDVSIFFPLTRIFSSLFCSSSFQIFKKIFCSPFHFPFPSYFWTPSPHFYLSSSLYTLFHDINININLIILLISINVSITLK